MNLARLKKEFPVENISEKEIAELRAREIEEDFDFEDIKKYIDFKKKMTNV